MMLVRIAWRNIWRNKRRTWIVLMSMMVGVAAAVFMDALARGFVKQMVENQLGLHIGHLEIHKRGFNDNKIVQNFMTSDSSVMLLVHGTTLIDAAAERTMAFGLVSSATSSSGASVVGISPHDEARVTMIKRCLVEGEYFTGAKREIVLSKKLAELLSVELGDRVVAMASALDGTVGSEVFRVVGIYLSPSSEFDRLNVYVPIATAQQMLHADRRIAEIAVTVSPIDSVPAVQRKLIAAVGDSLEVLSYFDLVPSLISQRELYDTMLQVFYMIIGIAMIFGVINTMMMSVFERIREFGVLKATGMNNGTLFRMVLLEAAVLAVIGTTMGAVIGVGGTFPLTHSGLNFSLFAEGMALYSAGSIVYPVLEPVSIVSGMIIIGLVCVAASVFPAIRAVRLVPVKAIHYV